MYLSIHPTTPEPRKIKQVAETLRNGGVIIYPTDTVYGIGCDITNHKAVERVCRLRRLDPDKAMLAMICSDMSQVSKYVAQLDNQLFRLIKQHLPGPYTFILKANNDVPKMFKNRKKTVGIRIPDNAIVQAIIAELGHPILTTSLKSDDEILDILPTQLIFTMILKISWTSSLTEVIVVMYLLRSLIVAKMA
jgi:tRNA threonylcarbamoyl adenosine modification protein (Sua5/YciO/YrdC/YwlC family)